MDIIKKNIKLVLIFFLITLISIFLTSGIYYIFGFSKGIYLPILFFLNLIIIYIFNLKLGKTKNKEPLQNSLIFSVLIIGIYFILNMIFFIKDFSPQNILYYIIIFITSLLGVLIGRRKKVQ